jgi:hypothetical protein
MEVTLTLPHTAPFLRERALWYSREHRTVEEQPDTDTPEAGWRPPACLAGPRHTTSLPGGSSRRYTTTLGCSSLAGCQDATRARATDTASYRTRGTGNAKSDALRAPAPVVGPHSGVWRGWTGVHSGSRARQLDQRGWGFCSPAGRSVPLRTDRIPRIYAPAMGVSISTIRHASRGAGHREPYRAGTVQKTVLHTRKCLMLRGFVDATAASLQVPLVVTRLRPRRCGCCAASREVAAPPRCAASREVAAHAARRRVRLTGAAGGPYAGAVPRDRLGLPAPA